MTKFYRNNIPTGFSREEFECKCGCGFDTVDTELLSVLIDVKKEFGGVPVIINSGCRCIEHNRAVGGAENSTHTKGLGADIVVNGVEAIEVYNYLNREYYHKYGIGRYSNRTHIDVRAKKARWECV